jgi:hypothetical protein
MITAPEISVMTPAHSALLTDVFIATLPSPVDVTVQAPAHNRILYRRLHSRGLLVPLPANSSLMDYPNTSEGLPLGTNQLGRRCREG